MTDTEKLILDGIDTLLRTQYSPKEGWEAHFEDVDRRREDFQNRLAVSRRKATEP